MTQYPESVYYEKEFYDEADVRDELRTRGLELEAALRSVKVLSSILDNYHKALKLISEGSLQGADCQQTASRALNSPVNK